MENMGKEVYSYNSECLTCNDRPILPIMGEFHFSRYPEKEWRSALENMKLGGVEITATYVFWIHHEDCKSLYTRFNSGTGLQNSFLPHILFRLSSAVEQSAVNRLVACSNQAAGAIKKTPS